MRAPNSRVLDWALYSTRSNKPCLHFTSLAITKTKTCKYRISGCNGGGGSSAFDYEISGLSHESAGGGADEKAQK